MVEAVDKVKVIIQTLEREKGPLSICGLFLREEPLEGWDIFISATWINSQEKESYKIVSSRLQKSLSDFELVQFSRVVILDQDDPVVSYLQSLKTITNNGYKELQSDDLAAKLGFTIKRVYLLDKPSIKSDIGDLGLWGGYFNSLKEAIQSLDKAYESLVGRLSYESTLTLQQGIEILLGEQCYMWGEVFPRCYGCVDSWGWEEIAKKNYDQAATDIKSSRLNGSARTDDLFDEPVYPMPTDTTYYVKFGEILQWASLGGRSLAGQLMNVLQIFQPDTNFHKRVTELQAAAQTVWYLHPEMYPDQLMEHRIIKEICGKEYSEKRFKEIVRSVDPRPPKYKTKNKNHPKRNPDPPQKVPDVMEEGGKLDLRRLQAVCKTIARVLKEEMPDLSSKDLLSHCLYQLYLKGAHPIIKEMATHWIAEVYGLNSNWFFMPIFQKS